MPTPGAFDRCFVALLARLWAEMEAVIAGLESHGGPVAGAQVELRMQALLLELHLLADRCDSTGWRTLLAPSQIEQVRVAVGELTRRLEFDVRGVAAERLHEALVAGQNYVFDVVHGRCLPPAARLEEDPWTRIPVAQPPLDRGGIVIHYDDAPGRALNA